MRRALVGLACLIALGTSSDALAATTQYPDLQTLPPRDLRFDRTDVSVAGTGDLRNVLRFSNTVVNRGQGPMVLKGTFGADTTSAPAVQQIYDSSGAVVATHDAGQYAWHAAHQHYHYDNWGRYELWTKGGYDAWVAAGRPSTMAPDLAGSKTTSCVMDEEFVAGLPGTPWPGVYPAGGCGLSGGSVMVQGLSVGWGDTYDYYRQEQWIDLGQGHLADGDYVLRSVTDPFNHVYESAGGADPARESIVANEGEIPFTVRGGQLVDGAPPTGTVSINGVDASTSSSQVSVRVLGRDDVSGVTSVRVSNDGVTWQTYAYGGSGSTPMVIAWDLADARFGGTTTGGTKTVYAQFLDASGKWSASETDSIQWTGGTAPGAPPPANSPYRDAVVADAPVSWWRLGEASGTAAADSRGPNGGTYNGAPALGSAGLLVSDPDKATGFDGVNDSVTTGDAGLAPGAAFSLEAWIRPAALPATGQFASIATRSDAYSLQFNGPLLEWTVIQGGARRRLQAPAGTIQTGKTYHVVGSYDGTTQRLYVDGVQIATAGLTGAVDAGRGFAIGSWDGGSEFFKGTIDDVAAYDKVLTGLQVKKHHDLGIATTVGVATPTGLAATASSGRIDLTWADNATNETSYALQRATNSSFTGATTVSLPAGATAYADTALPAGTTYFYRVQALAASDSSAWSNTASASTPSAPPPPPPPPPGGTPPPSYASTVLADGPLSYWRLDEASGTTAKDEKGANPGTYAGGTLLGVKGLLGETADRAARFDGSNDRVSVPDTTALGLTTNFSLEAWIRPSFLPANGSFASVLSKAEAYSLQFNGPLMEFTVIQGGARRRLQAPAGTVKAGGIYHVVGTYDGARQRLYVNGTEVTNRAQTGAASKVTYALYLGSWNGSGEFFGGDVDEAAVYAKTLSAAQISAHYKAGSPPAVAAYRVQPRRRTKAAQQRTRQAVARKHGKRIKRTTGAWTAKAASLEPLCHLERRDKRRLMSRRVTFLSS